MLAKSRQSIEEKNETEVRNGSLNPFEGSSKVQEDSDQRNMQN